MKSTTQHSHGWCQPIFPPEHQLFFFPILVINKNIPPWLSMKNERLMLALIVPGRRQVKNMDVYLQPLVDELKELWDGINVYDLSKPIVAERSFTLFGICAYTTHD